MVDREAEEQKEVQDYTGIYTDVGNDGELSRLKFRTVQVDSMPSVDLPFALRLDIGLRLFERDSPNF